MRSDVPVWRVAAGRRVRWIVVALVATLAPGIVRAAPVATGSIPSITIASGPPGGPPLLLTFTTTVSDQTFDVFGTSIDLGITVGSMDCTSGVTLGPDPNGGTFMGHCQTSDPSVFQYDAAGDYTVVCDDPGCTSDHRFFVGTLSNVSGTAVSELPPDLTYTEDGVVYPALGFAGTATINAYQPNPTPASPAGCSGAGCVVTTSTSGTFLDPSGALVPIPVDITFTDVATAGTTTVVGLSNVAAAPPSNITLNGPGFPAIFFDVSTTASVTPPITLCFQYADADNDGVVDGTSVDETMLRILHLENGTFVDVTSSLDATNNVICGQTSSLSPFAIAVLKPTCGLGAGLPGKPGKPNGNIGTVKIAPGATGTPSTKNTTVKLSGTLDNCSGFGAMASKYPITAGTFTAPVTLPPGATCSALVAGPPVKTKVRVVWKGINPKTGKLATAATSDVSTFMTFSESLSPRGFDATSAPLAGKKSLFLGRTLQFHTVIDESPSDIATLCAAKGGLKALHFTNPSSMLTVN